VGVGLRKAISLVRAFHSGRDGIRDGLERFRRYNTSPDWDSAARPIVVYEKQICTNSKPYLYLNMVLDFTIILFALSSHMKFT
jgi:hypothetical protein